MEAGGTFILARQGELSGFRGGTFGGTLLCRVLLSLYLCILMFDLAMYAQMQAKMYPAM